mgnify:FL=1
MNFFNSFVDKGLLDRLNHVINSEFGHVTYTEAVELLEKNNDKFDYKVFWGCDLQTEHERYLTEEIFKKPVFVTDYPKEIKAFYMKMNEDNKTVAAMDCLVPGSVRSSVEARERMTLRNLRNVWTSWDLRKRIMTSILIFVNMVPHAIQDLVLDLNVA